MSKLVKLDDGFLFDMERIVAGEWLADGRYRIVLANGPKQTYVYLTGAAGEALLRMIPRMTETEPRQA